MKHPPGTSPLLAFSHPRLRGVSHKYAFFGSLVAGALLVLLAPTGRAVLAAAVYGASLSGVFGVSALYHRTAWSPRGYRRMKRLDHAMIYLLIAGSFTPYGMLVLSSALAAVILWVVWGGAAAGIVLKLAWIDAPRWLSAVLYVGLGWVGVAAMPELVVRMGWVATGLLFLGGLLYSAGAIVYALRRPNLSPTVFGYHELFHALVIAAALTQYAVVALFVLPNTP